MNRRRWLAAAGTGLAAVAGWRLWPEDGLGNPCLDAAAGELARLPIVREALDGLDGARIWDVHAHLLAAPHGRHDGPWPAWLARMQAAFIANAACVDGELKPPEFVDAYLARLLAQLDAMPAGCRVVLLAMDGYHDESGQLHSQRTHFSVANALCAAAARRYPARIEWAASVHPYRRDAAALIRQAKHEGARAIKWIPAAQGIDPASPLCDDSYRAMSQAGLALIAHAGEERATAGDDALGNPLRLRRALDHGVRVIAAHCATMGESRDIDRGEHGPWVDNFRLFARLMEELRYQRHLYGDLAALPQTARAAPLKELIPRAAAGGDWHGRLLYGSDYPLPGVMPLYSPARLAADGLLDAAAVAPLRELRRRNVLLFDLVLKRLLRVGGHRLADAVFHTRDIFAAAA